MHHPRRRSRVLVAILAFMFVVSATPLASLISAQADPVRADRVMRLGPLPLAAPAGDLDARVHAERSVVPELDPHDPFPAAKWTETGAASGTLRLPGRGVWWLSARLVADRWTRATFTTGEVEADVWVDGEPVAGEIDLPAGACRVLVRVAAEDDDTSVSLGVEGEASFTWDVSTMLDMSRFDRSRLLASIGSVAVAPRGKLIARVVSRRHATGEGRDHDLSVFDGRGELVASDLGGPDARPIAFTPDGTTLLLRRPGHDGTDVLAWTVPRGPMRTVVAGEPDLGLVDLDAGGRFLLLASTRGLEAREPDDDQRRWDALRERVTDWQPRPHLHVVDLTSGLRHVLTAPGDYTLDDAAWLPGSERVVYARTRPQTERPWFTTEIRTVDRDGRSDRLVATFTGGWEVRPQALTPHPDGTLLAFIGPPDQVGGGRPERNVYQKQLWLLDLDSGEFERITGGMPYSFEGARGLPAWSSDGQRLLASGLHRSGEALVQLAFDGERWVADPVPTEGPHASGWSLGPEAEVVAYVTSGPAQPRSLWLQAVGGRARQIDNPDLDLPLLLALARAEDASFTGPGGETIEAWWYRPLRAGREPVPLIVYYYGGSVPTARGINTTHQFWAANGYAVLVINPRGAVGYGQTFADWHAGDWGEAAGADILAGTEALLARHPELDREAIGCYGGSYGGFMTMHLVTRSDLFGAACAMYGIADLATYWGQGAWGWTYGDMAMAGRMPWEHPEYFTERSPLYQAGNVNTPLLLLHGAEDANVTPGQSAEMFTALQVQGKPVEMVTFAGEDHGIAGTWENYVAHRTMMLEWFDRWLKGRPEAWEARWE